MRTLVGRNICNARRNARISLWPDSPKQLQYCFTKLEEFRAEPCWRVGAKQGMVATDSRSTPEGMRSLSLPPRL